MDDRVTDTPLPFNTGKHSIGKALKQTQESCNFLHAALYRHKQVQLVAMDRGRICNQERVHEFPIRSDVDTLD